MRKGCNWSAKALEKMIDTIRGRCHGWRESILSCWRQYITAVRERKSIWRWSGRGLNWWVLEPRWWTPHAGWWNLMAKDCPSVAHSRWVGSWRLNWAWSCARFWSPLLKEIESLNERIREYDARMEKIAQESYPQVARLKQVKGVGTQIALTYVLTIEDPQRFPKSREVGCFLGAQGFRREATADAHQ
jgi:Transposase IS116/IS110/IS902 family